MTAHPFEILFLFALYHVPAHTHAVLIGIFFRDGSSLAAKHPEPLPRVRLVALLVVLWLLVGHYTSAFRDVSIAANALAGVEPSSIEVDTGQGRFY